MLAIFAKEVLDTLRDRRSLFSALAYVLIGPLAVVFTVNVLAASTRPDALQPVAFCAGAPPDLVAHLKTTGIVFTESAKICIDVPADYARRLADGGTARIGLRGDLSAAAATVRKLETEIGRYSRMLSIQRTLARGIAPSVTHPIVVDRRNLNSVSVQAEVIARVLITFFVLTPFFVSVAAAADMTAGERERRSLEGLLAYPIGALEIVVGKWLAAAALGVFGTAVCIFGGLWLMQRSALPELGLRLATDFTTGTTVLAMLAPLCLLAAAVQIAIGFAARSYKDAQSYLTLLAFAPGIAGFVLAGERLAAASDWPLGWELAALGGPLLGSATTVPAFAYNALVELGLVGIALAFAAARLRSERMLSQA